MDLDRDLLLLWSYGVSSDGSITLIAPCARQMQATLAPPLVTRAFPTNRFGRLRTPRGWSIGRCRWTPQSPVRISTQRTPPASQGAGSNYTNLSVERPDYGIGRCRDGLSTKIHQLIDGDGLPLVTLITPRRAGDSPMFLPLMAQLRVERDSGRPRTRPDAVRGDKAYSCRAIRGHRRSRGIKAAIPGPDDQKGHRQRRGARGGRPVGLDAADYKTGT